MQVSDVERVQRKQELRVNEVWENTAFPVHSQVSRNCGKIYIMGVGALYFYFNEKSDTGLLGDIRGSPSCLLG